MGFGGFGGEQGGEQQFAAQGLSLTDRGYHSLGSVNHLGMFGTDYLELIGLPAPGTGEPVKRAGVSDAPYGINGLVFKTDDADQLFRHLGVEVTGWLWQLYKRKKIPNTIPINFWLLP